MAGELQPRTWFLRDGEREIGPLPEPELRQRLLQIARPQRHTVQVRQGNGRWYPAEQVLAKFKELAANGIYLKIGGQQQGPFTAARAYELLQTPETLGAEAKIGREAEWVPAGRLLKHLQRAIRQGEQRTASANGRPKSNRAASSTSTPELIPEAIVVEEIPEAVIVEPDPVSSPASVAFNAVHQPMVTAQPAAWQSPSSPPGFHQPAQSKTRVNASDSTSSKKVLGVLGSILSILFFVGLASLKAYSRYQRRAEPRETIDSATTELVEEQHGTPPGRTVGIHVSPE